MRSRALFVVLPLLLAPSATTAGIEEWCTEPEQVGDVAPGAECHGYLMLVGEVVEEAALCWEEISPDLPADEWQAERDWCEDQAHLAVCGQIPCYD